MIQTFVFWLAEIVQLSYLTPGVGELFLYASVGVAVFCAASLLFAVKRYRMLAIVATVLLPFALGGIYLAKRGLSGTPDDNCGAYEGGNLVFSLQTLPALEPVDPTKPFGKHNMLLLVRASKRFGSDSHLCRVSLEDPVARRLRNLLGSQVEQKWEMVRNGRGQLTFTFGGKDTPPNVTFIPKPPGEKTGPPDNAPGRSREG